MVYLLVFLAICAMTTAHLLLKQGMLSVGPFPQDISQLGSFLLRTCTNPYVIGSAILTIVTAVSWIFAISRAQLSYLYPFMALSFVLVAIFSLVLFKEDITALRWFGISIICIGVFLVARS
jgi:uncharacterized membrane protein